MKLGVVILNYNDSSTTLSLIARIKDYSKIDHIVVVDNKSTDNSYEIMKKYRGENSSWDLIQTDSNKGYAYGNNYGVKYLTNKYDIDIICIANPDVIFSNEFLDKILFDFRYCEKYSLLTGIQLKNDKTIGKHPFWNLMTAGNLILSNLKILSKLFLRKKILARNMGITEVDVVEGCLFFIRKKDFLEVDGLDENTFLYFEEDILAIRLKKLGKICGVDTDISFIHNHSTSIKKELNNKKIRNRLLSSKRYLYYAYLEKGLFTNMLFEISCYIYRIETVLLEPIINFYKTGKK